MPRFSFVCPQCNSPSEFALSTKCRQLKKFGSVLCTACNHARVYGTPEELAEKRRIRDRKGIIKHKRKNGVIPIAEFKAKVKEEAAARAAARASEREAKEGERNERRLERQRLEEERLSRAEEREAGKLKHLSRDEYLAYKRKVRRKWHAANPDYLKKQWKRQKDDPTHVLRRMNQRQRVGRRAGMTPVAVARAKTREQSWYWFFGESKNQTRKEAHKTTKIEFIEAYGGACIECGERDVVVLTADHVHNDGKDHRDARGWRIGSNRLYKWAKDNGWPDTLQLLCMSCNLAKAIRLGVRNKWATRRKERVIRHYAPDGMCPCGESDMDKLTIDHIGGGGRAEKRKLRESGASDSVYATAINEGFPPRFRVLCMNCNYREHDPVGGTPPAQLKCYQRVVRDEREADARERHPDLFDRPINDFALTMEPLSGDIRDFISLYEWKGGIGNTPKWCFTARIDGVLAGASVVTNPISPSKLVDGLGAEHECLIDRGASAPFAHPHLPSKLTMFAVNWLVANTTKRAFTGYSDPSAGEVGTIYSACNFDFMGWSFGVKEMYSHPLIKNGRPFGSQMLSRTSSLKKYLKSVGVPWLPGWSKDNGFKDLAAIPHHIIADWRAWNRKVISESTRMPIPEKGKWCLVRGRGKLETRSLMRRRIYVGEPKPMRYAWTESDLERLQEFGQ